MVSQRKALKSGLYVETDACHSSTKVLCCQFRCLLQVSLSNTVKPVVEHSGIHGMQVLGVGGGDGLQASGSMTMCIAYCKTCC